MRRNKKAELSLPLRAIIIGLLIIIALFGFVMCKTIGG